MIYTHASTDLLPSQLQILILLLLLFACPAAMAPPSEQAPAKTHMPCAAGAAIPDVILLDIFMRLPARSVARCRCLSRAWAAALAPSNDFTDCHFRAANRRPSLFVLPVPSTGVTAVSAWSPDQPHGTTLVAFPRRPMRNAGTRPCRGLIVMEEEDPPTRATDASVYYVCNPSTGQMTALPEGRPVPPQPFRYHYEARDRRCYDSLGIGYDSVSCKFKVVRVVCRYGDDDYLPDCDVYVVDDGFCWRPAMGHAELPEAFGYTSSYEASVSAQGHIYWMSEAEGPFKDKRVISFSLSDETFGVIQPPSHCSKYGLTELEGRACLFSSVSGVHHPQYDIWLLRDDDGDAHGAWDLRCRINLAAAPPDVKRFMACLVRPLAFMDGGRRILFRPGVVHCTNDSMPIHKLCAYTLATGAMEKLHTDGSLIAMPSEGSATTKAVVYEESLVSTGRPHEEILFSTASARALCIALHRLPAPDLGKLKLVCRAWRSIIETERFINLHSRYSRATRRSPLHVFFPDAAPEDRRPESSLLLASPKLLDDRVVSCKPCHGLLLVTSSNGNNVRILSPLIDEEMDFSFVSEKGVRKSSGMGYDEVTEEHVMVTLELASGALAMECHVWRVKQGVTRTMACPPSIRVWLDVPPVYVDGKMYWMGKRSGHHDDESTDNMIMVLDIHTEAFEVMAAPRADDGCRMVVAELAGKLCVAHPCAHRESMTIWSMDAKLDRTTVGEQGWTREHVIDLSLWPEFSPKTAAGLVVPVEVEAAGDGRILLDTGRAVGLYDPRERTMHTVYSLNWRPGKRTKKFVAVAVWEDSLVRPPQGSGQPDRWYRDV